MATILFFVLLTLSSQKIPGTKKLILEKKAVLADLEQPYRGMGNDISWPQCDVIDKMPKNNFGIVGVTGGRAFTGNPCLKEEFEWAQATGSASVYINVHLGGDDDPERSLKGRFGNCNDSDLSCQVKNYGYNTAKEAVSYARSQNVKDEKMWWLDVEELNNWSDDPLMNRQIIDGAVSYFSENGLPVGIYSTPLMWRDLTDNYQNGLPVWPAIISDSPSLGCGIGFTGGKTYVVQYNQDGVDKNFACI